MNLIGRLVALVAIFCVTSTAWLVLAGVMGVRTSEQEGQLSGAVAELWGQPMQQDAPRLAVERTVWRDQEVDVVGADGQVVQNADGSVRRTVRRVAQAVEEPAALASSDIDVDLELDQRRKGLLWFSLYDVDFSGRWTYTHTGTESGTLVIRFPFPVADGIYDDFRFEIDGAERWDATPQSGQVTVRVPVEPDQTVAFGASYHSRGRDQFVVRPVSDWQASEVRDLNLTITTDFDEIDFPSQTVSPSSRTEAGTGHELVWDFRRLVTGRGMGVTMPKRIQAGPLGAMMALSAPISLGLYMAWITVLGLLKRVEVHPVNHLFLAAAFFAFHLLFAYSADHLPVEAAFALSAVTSVFLTTSYLRLVTGARFALVEAGIAQLLYQVGFSLAHFFDGATGLTVTVLGIGTLFFLMQLTGRIKWAEQFSRA